MERNLTTGSVWSAVFRFSLPYLLSYFLQTLYGLADLYIIGRFDGVESTTAVSTGSQVMHMITVMIVGLSMGATILIGQAVGAGEKKRASRTIGNTITLFVAVSAAVTVLLFLLVKPIVSVMSTPEEAVPGTISYLRICFLGIPFITAYNVIGSLFRGMGDSKSPMYFVAVACGANIVLDFLLIGGLKLGPAGAALGTTLAQTISVAVSIAVILKRKGMGIQIAASDLKPDFPVMGRIIRIGAPIALQDGFIQISFLAITIFANQRGLNDAAAVGIVEKIISLLFLVPSSMLQTVSVLSAQNIGAGKDDRARKTLWCAILISEIWGLIAVITMEWKAELFIGLFTASPEVVVMGGQYIRGYVIDCMIAAVHFCFSGYFCAYGRSGISFSHNLLSILIARIPLSYLASKRFPDTLFPMGIAAPIGSILSVAICIIAFLWLRKRQKEKGIL